MNFVIIRAIYSLACLFTSFLLLKTYKKSGKKNKSLRDFAVAFFLLAFYLMLLVTYIVTDNLIIISFGYDLAVTLYFIFVAIFFNIALSFLEVKKRTRIELISILLLIGSAIVIYQLITPNIPFVTDTPGLVLWGLHPFILAVTGMAGFSVGHVWAYIFYINLENSTNFRSKLKSFIIMTSSSALGFSSLTYFYPSELSFFLSFIFGFIGVFGFLTVALLRLKK